MLNEIKSTEITPNVSVTLHRLFIDINIKGSQLNRVFVVQQITLNYYMSLLQNDIYPFIYTTSIYILTVEQNTEMQI